MKVDARLNTGVLANRPEHHVSQQGENLESARLALEAYWKKIEGTSIMPARISKKRSHQGLGGMNTPKKQKPGRKDIQTLSLGRLARPSAGFTQVRDGPSQKSQERQSSKT